MRLSGVRVSVIKQTLGCWSAIEGSMNIPLGRKSLLHFLLFCIGHSCCVTKVGSVEWCVLHHYIDGIMATAGLKMQHANLVCARIQRLVPITCHDRSNEGECQGMVNVVLSIELMFIHDTCNSNLYV